MDTNQKKILFIVNPFSGTSNKQKFHDLVDQHLDLTKFDPEIAITKYAGHGPEIAKKAIESGTHYIVAVGGDGTVNEIAKCVCHTEAIMGIIPGGSGNGFSRHLSLPTQTGQAISILNTGKISKVDTCEVNDHFFVNVAGLGFDAKIAYITKHSKKRGFWHYFKATMVESGNYEVIDLTVTVDGKVTQGKYVAAIVANASRYGFQFTVAPDASISDGMMDIILIKEAPVYKYFLSAYRFLNNTLPESNIVEALKGKEITIESAKPVYLHVDGEGITSDLKFTYKIHPHSLNLMVPPM